MNESTLQKAFTDKGCFLHQAEFAAAFFAPDSARKHLLVGAPGMGKKFASAAIVNHAMSRRMVQRVLVLVPSALLTHWQETIGRVGTTPVIIVDRRRFRELEDAQPVGEDIWPGNAVVLLSLDFAKQPDVAANLVRSSWDLLIVDEVQLASPQTLKARVLVDLITRCPEMRVLLLQVGMRTTAEPVKAAEFLRDAVITVWTRENIRGHQGTPLLPEVHMEWITYRRQPEEAELLARLQDAVRSLHTTNPQMRLAAATLLQAASSSSFALEQRLRRIRQRRNEVGHSVQVNVPDEIDAEEVGMDGAEAGATGDQVAGYLELSTVTEPILKLLENLPTDAKCDALVGFLDSLGTLQLPDRRACVLTRFVDTATYLASVLRERCPQVKVLTGGISSVDREQAVAEFAQGGRILIVTEAVKTPLPEVAAVVFYDLPLNPAVLESRVGQFVRVGRRGPVRMVAFSDESDALVIERLQRRIAESDKALSEKEIEGALFTSEESQRAT